jgi:hypothetical protein
MKTLFADDSSVMARSNAQALTISTLQGVGGKQEHPCTLRQELAASGEPDLLDLASVMSGHVLW